MPEKNRFSVSLDLKTNAVIERLARRHKPELPKSYIVEFALVRLLGAVDAKQLTLSPLLNAGANASR